MLPYLLLPLAVILGALGTLIIIRLFSLRAGARAMRAWDAAPPPWGLVDECEVEVLPSKRVGLALRAEGEEHFHHFTLAPAHAREVSGDLLRAHALLRGTRTQDDAPEQGAAS